MDNASWAPIAVFAYNRLDHFEKMFASLRACRGFDKSSVTIFLDGAKSEKDRPHVEAVRAFARAIQLPNVHLVESLANKGLKNSIAQGVSALCREHGRVIVMEDDLLVAPCLLEYFNQGLEKYKDDPRVWSLVGYQYDVPALRGRDTALLLPFAHCWGWATWDRAWSTFDVKAPIDDALLQSRAFQRFFDIDGVRDFTAMLDLEKKGLINSWFIRWNYKIFLEHGVCVFPPETYVANIGMGAGGTHASGLSPYARLVHPQPPKDVLVSFPDVFSLDILAIDAIRQSWDARVQTWVSILGRLKRNLKTLWKKKR